jgi:GNAT superfamily N-acetyltransferase
MCEVVRTTVAALWDDPYFDGLVDEYAAESSIEGLPHPKNKRETYEMLESVGALTVFGAYQDRHLIGFLTILLPIMPHYGEVVATTESYFVGADYRKSGAGLKLLRAAEVFAKEADAQGFLVAAPSGGRLAEVMPKLGYTESNRVFFRSFMCTH